MARISEADKKKVRRALLQSAARHFAKSGLGGANINKISVDAGYARGTVYNYFDSKEDLFAAVLQVGSEQTLADYRARAVQGDTRAHLEALVTADVALVRQHTDVMKIFVRELVAPQPGTRELVQRGIAPLVVEVADILQRDPDLRSDLPVPQQATVFLGLLTMGYVQHWTSGWPTWDELPGLVVTLFLDGAHRRA